MRRSAGVDRPRLLVDRSCCLRPAPWVWPGSASLPRSPARSRCRAWPSRCAIVRDAHAIPHVDGGRARPTPTSPWASCTARTGCGRWSSTGWPARAGWRRCWARRRCPIDRYLRTLGLARRAEADAGADVAGGPGPARGLRHGRQRRDRRLRPGAAAGVPAAAPPARALAAGRQPAARRSCWRSTCRGNWREELLRARLAQRLSPDQLADLWPGEAPGAGRSPWRRWTACRSMLWPRLCPTRPAAGHRLQRLGRRRQPDGERAAAARQRPASAAAAAGPMVSGPARGAGPQRDRRHPARAAVRGARAQPRARLGLLQHRLGHAGPVRRAASIPADPGRYLTPDGSEPFAVRHEEIVVRGGAPVALEVRATRHGPVVSDLCRRHGRGRRARARAGTRLDPATAVTTRPSRPGSRSAGRRTRPQFVAAAERYTGAQQNMAFAVRDGTIGMISPGLVPDPPRRVTASCRCLAGPATTTGSARSRPTELPRAVDPPGGLLVNANNRLVDAELSLSAHRRLGAALPGEADRRAARRPPGSGRGCRSPRCSSTSPPPWRRRVPALPAGCPRRSRRRGASCSRRCAPGTAGPAPDRPEPLLFAAWYASSAGAIAGDELGPAVGRAGYRQGARLPAPRAGRTARSGATSSARRRWRPAPSGRPLAFETAMAGLEQRYGPDWRSWRWGDAHPGRAGASAVRAEPAAAAALVQPAPAGRRRRAARSTWPMPGATRDELPFGAVHAAGYRAIYDLAAPDRSRWIAADRPVRPSALAPLSSTLPSAWQEGRYLAMSMDPAAYHAGALGVLELQPVATAVAPHVSDSADIAPRGYELCS